MSNDKKVDQETVLLTGASGFIGLHCVKQLIQPGFKVPGTVRSLEKQKLVQEVMAANQYHAVLFEELYKISSRLLDRLLQLSYQPS